MELVIRKVLAKDIPVMLEIQKKAFLVQARMYDAYNIPPMIETEDDIDLYSDKLKILVAESEGKLIGSVRIAFGDNDAEIKRLSVADGLQNKGIGRKLLNEAEKHCAGLERIWLFTGGQSKKNISLYTKMGYAPYKEEPFKDQFTLIYMEKLL